MDHNSPEHPRTYTIFVNGRERTVSDSVLTFAQVIALAPPTDVTPSANTVFTVTYSKGDDQKPLGSLVDGGSVKIKNGMHFNVSATDRS